jgi:AcrR family transcriptional regulator
MRSTSRNGEGSAANDDRSEVIAQLAEVFRTYGYEGASLTRITQGTGLGKGSLYHLFPGGKDEMAQAVLAHIDLWFELNVFAPLRENAAEADDDYPQRIAHMFDACGRYFLSGRKVCLVGAFALDSTRDRFADAVRGYFVRWAEALHAALLRAGHPSHEAAALTEDILGGIQGALVLARAVNQADIFTRTLERLQERVKRAAAAHAVQKRNKT